jgi:MATE family multidrug resistance protein
MGSSNTAAEELSSTLRLAGPVVLAELGWMSMGVVDMLMVGRLGPEAIGAVGLGGTLFVALAVFGMGLFLGLDTLVSQAYGARRLDDCHRWLVHGVVAALALGAPLHAVAMLVSWSLPAFRLNPAVLALTAPYVDIVIFSALPLLLYSAFRRYLQGVHVVRPIMIALVSANVVNAVANWILIFGNLGAPALGVRGAAWATVVSRAYMAAVLLCAIVLNEGPGLAWLRRARGLERARFARLFDLGLPAAAQISLEVGVFAVATALAGRLDAASLAAHQIALTVAGVMFMVPLGISSAGAVRVGHAIGRGDPAAAGRAGWIALGLGAAFMSGSALLMIAAPQPLLRLFTSDPPVIATGVALLAVAAVFQLFDGVQVVATGALRGLGDTRTPMVSNLVGHWALGLPVGYTLCFWLNTGVVGLWGGLSAGLIAVGAVLLYVWQRDIRRLRLAKSA